MKTWLLISNNWNISLETYLWLLKKKIKEAQTTKKRFVKYKKYTIFIDVEEFSWYLLFFLILIPILHVTMKFNYIIYKTIKMGFNPFPIFFSKMICALTDTKYLRTMWIRFHRWLSKNSIYGSKYNSIDNRNFLTAFLKMIKNRTWERLLHIAHWYEFS